ncbi:MAG: PIN domain-containing protein [Coriobacteriia bacterium]|nr:PIN domain-containing protein [Coriobacteriia bacterium]
MISLLDTNVISELSRKTPDPKVINWINAQEVSDLAISVLTAGEIVYGYLKLPECRKKDQLRGWFEVDFMEWIQDRIFPVTEAVVRDWAALKATSRPLPVVDSLLAATAIAANATLVTRNTKDFAGVKGLKLVNPWK